mmetsp:Transcript_21182/g.50288  ORF Transcript_21182/g.50288 Transcript_21182/m.50288 type:complete len:220 (-) Transcript_21182:1208-1867(-)
MVVFNSYRAIKTFCVIGAPSRVGSFVRPFVRSQHSAHRKRCDARSPSAVRGTMGIVAGAVASFARRKNGSDRTEPKRRVVPAASGRIGSGRVGCAYRVRSRLPPSVGHIAEGKDGSRRFRGGRGDRAPGGDSVASRLFRFLFDFRFRSTASTMLFLLLLLFHFPPVQAVPREGEDDVVEDPVSLFRSEDAPEESEGGFPFRDVRVEIRVSFEDVSRGEL